MKKTKVLYQLNELGYGGTTKAILTFIENLDAAKFEPYLFVRSNKGTFKYYRLFIFQFLSKKHKKRFEELYLKSLARLKEFEKLLGSEKIFFGRWNEFKSVINAISPDIVHFNRGDPQDFYTDKINVLDPKIKLVETNIFARKSSDEYHSRLDKTYFVSKYCLKKSPWSGEKGDVLYNPIQKAKTPENLRDKYNIPANAVVLGQIGRPDLYQDDFIYNVYQKIKAPNVYLMVLGCTKTISKLKKSSDQIITIAATSDRNVVDAFYNTIDVLLHRRLDGETFGMNIAEGMINEKPVVSHYSDVDNAQAELLDDKEFGQVGFITNVNDLDSYVLNVNRLIENETLRKKMGENAKTKALKLYEERAVTEDLEKKYLVL